MPEVLVLHERQDPARDLIRLLNLNCRPRPMPLARFEASSAPDADLVVIDADLEDEATWDHLGADVVPRLPQGLPVIALTTTSGERRRRGASSGKQMRLCPRPLESSRFVEMLNALISQRQASPQKRMDGPAERQARQEKMALEAPELGTALAAGDEALASIFSFAQGSGPLRADTLRQQGDAIITSLDGGSLSRWVGAVRHHHDATYQHCMLVMGVAVAFGLILRIPRHDIQRLTLAALLHDVGKAQTPASILDKPGPLTPEEMQVMREHPVAGAKLIAGTPGIDATVLGVVRHHHEFLDGSGYPDGLRGDAIPDLVRLSTIADVFAALVEKRSYKPAMSGLAAYDILVGMGPKLDQPLVRVMRAVAKDF